MTEWIFTKDELPKASESNSRISNTVLIYDGYDIMTGWYHFGDRGWRSFDIFCRTDRPIIAWMPLPKPPKEE